MASASELRAEVEAMGRRYRGQPYPRSLRTRLTRYARERVAGGGGWYQVGKELGVRAETLMRWCEQDEEESVAFLPVLVEESGAAASSLVLVSPAGWRVEGISLEQAVAILQATG